MSRIPLLPERKRPLIFAHRGCSSLAPENTMAAFKKAREYGAPGLELDIHTTLDGKLVVTHDDTFTRTALSGNNGNGKKPEELDYSEIQQIDVGSFFNAKFSAERPPLLETVLEEFCPAMYVDIELKSRKTKNDPLPELLAKTLTSLGSKICSAVTVSSFNPFCLKAFKQKWKNIQNTAGGKIPDIPTAVIWSADKEVPAILRYGLGRILSYCDYLKPVHTQVNSFSMFLFSLLERRPVIPWTIDEPALAKKMIARGCEGIITNKPQEIVPLFQS